MALLERETPRASRGRTPDDLISATVWDEGQNPEPLDLNGERPISGIRWFDVGSEADARSLFEFLAPLCEGLTEEMLGDLVQPDRLPEGDEWDAGEIRLASTFAVYPTKTKNGRGDWSCPEPSPNLTYQPVELVSNGDWLITCWHASETYCGWSRVGGPQPPRRHDEICHGVAKRWIKKHGLVAADLGVLVMHELALTYAPAHRQLYAALEEWELSLYGDVHGDGDVKSDFTNLDADPKTLRDLWRARARMLDWLNPLNTAGLNEEIDKAWLPATDHDEVKRVDHRVDKALAALSRLGENLRASFHSLQLLTAEGQRDRNEKRQRRVERMAAIFLIPTLVVGFYGANTWVPGQQRHWGFWVMVVIILTLTTIGWHLVTALHSRDAVGLPKFSWRGLSRSGDGQESR